MNQDVWYVNALDYAVANLKRIFALLRAISDPAVVGRALLLLYMRLLMFWWRRTKFKYLF